MGRYPGREGREFRSKWWGGEGAEDSIYFEKSTRLTLKKKGGKRDFTKGIHVGGGVLGFNLLTSRDNERGEE